MVSSVETQSILEMLEQGKITADDAVRLLAALDDNSIGENSIDDMPDAILATSENTSEVKSPGEQGDHSAVEALETSMANAYPGVEKGEIASETSIPPDLGKWRQYWIVPFTLAFLFLLLSAYWMARAYESSGAGFWFYCAWIPMLISVAALSLAWFSRSLPWLHLRIKQAEDEWPRNISFSFPLPVGIASWVLRNFGSHIHGLERSGMSVEKLERLIQGLGEHTSPQTPIYIKVDDDADGDQVFIYIG